MGSIALTVLALAFIPLSALAAKKIFPFLKPPEHRPFVFFISGLLLFLVGAGIVYLLHEELQSGILDFKSRRYGDIYADALVQPFKYWFIVLFFYATAVITSGTGLAGFGLCFRRDSM